MCAYSGYVGDCGPYHGWVVGVDIKNPSNVMAWATAADGGGIWGHGGVASDGTKMFVVTGNTFHKSGGSMEWRRSNCSFSTPGLYLTTSGRLLIGRLLDGSRYRSRRLQRHAHRCARRKSFTAGARFGQRSQCLFARSQQPGRCRSGGSFAERIQCHA